MGECFGVGRTRVKGKAQRTKQVRTRDWSDKKTHDHAFTHDRARHRKAAGAPPTLLPLPVIPDSATPNGLVISHSGKWAFVQIGDTEHLCLIDDAMRCNRASLLCPGDEVFVSLSGEHPLVQGVAQRRTKLSRLAPVHSSLEEQVVAANVDLLVVVASASRPAFKPGVIDRFLVNAQIGGVTPVAVINKMDLVDAEPEAIAMYRGLGLPIVGTSCTTGQGLDELRSLLQGKLSVVAGHSGVGKSSLLNALDPELTIATQEVSKTTDKGRHTTTASRLYRLRDEIRIIDTPGARNLGIWGISTEEVSYYFPELAEYAVGCKFRDCTHIHEPECAVLEAVESGKITKLRYSSYRRIRDSISTGHP